MPPKRIDALPKKMAQVLAETVAELSDRIACRRSLAFAGFTDSEISEHLNAARMHARRLLASEADRLTREQRKK
jgi:hypothetical protein